MVSLPITFGNGRLFTWVGAVVVAIAVLVGGAVLLRYWWTHEQMRRETELRPFLVPPVSVGRHVYTFGDQQREGESNQHPLAGSIRALRLAHYAVLARTDPIFGLSGVDTAGLRAATMALGWGAGRLSTSPEYPWLAEGLLPVEFLAALPELEERRRALLAAPSEESARNYQASLERTAEHALASLENLKRTIRSAATIQREEDRMRRAPDAVLPVTFSFPFDAAGIGSADIVADIFTVHAAFLRFRRVLHTAAVIQVGRAGSTDGDRLEIAFLRTRSNEEQFLVALDELARGFRRQQVRIWQRGGCLSLVRACHEAITFAWPPAVSRMGPVSVGQPADADVMRILQTYWRHQGIEPGARTIWMETNCFGAGMELHPFIPFRLPPGWTSRHFLDWEGPDAGEIFEPNLQSRLYFLDLERVSPAARAAHQTFLQEGFSLFWQSATSFYTCPDLGYLGRLSSAVRIIEDLEHRPLFRAVDGGGKISWLGELAAMEAELVGSEQITEGEVLAFAGRIAAILHERGEAAVAAAIGRDAVLRSEGMVAGVFQASSAFDELVAAGASQNYFLTQRWLQQPFPVSPLLIALSRSAPSLYFLTFNGAFVPSPPVFSTGQLFFSPHLFLDRAEAAARVPREGFVRLLERSVVFSHGNARAR